MTTGSSMRPYPSVTTMNDSEFDDLLRSAKGDFPLPGSFRQGVWHRVEAAGLEPKPGFAWFHVFLDGSTRPWSAASGLAAIIAMGLWLGASSTPDSTSERMAYANSISPFTRNHQK